jgi:amino acid transporter
MNAVENNKSSQLVRALGLWSATAVIVGSMIGQAVFLVASDMARELGSPTRVVGVWVIGGVVVLFGSFCYAELGAALPEESGGGLTARTLGESAKAPSATAMRMEADRERRIVRSD